MQTASDLYRFGNARRPREARIPPDLYPDADGIAGPEGGPAPNGLSLYAMPDTSGLTGHYWRLPMRTELRYGLTVVADGEDVGGPRARGHHTLYPSVRMPSEEFRRLVAALPWAYAGKL